MCWTLSQVFPSGMQELTTILFPFLDLWTNILQGMHSSFFFYDEEFWVLRDIKSYLENYNFKIHSKFVVLKSMHRTNLEFPNKKVNLLWNSTKASCVHVSSILTYLLYYMS